MGDPDHADDAPDDSPLEVLLVEDNLDHAMMIKQAANETEDLELAHVRTGEEAMGRIRRGTFHALVLDYRLPDWDGVKLCQELRERGFEGTVVLLSSARRDTLGDSALEAGADDYLSKSGGFERRLLDAIRSQAGGSGG